MELQIFCGNELHPLLWTVSRTERGKIIVSRIPNCLICCEFYIVYTQFTNMAADSIIQPGGPRVEDPCCIDSAWKFLLNYYWDKFVFLCYYSMINPLKFRFKLFRLLTSLRALHVDFVAHECIAEFCRRNKTVRGRPDVLRLCVLFVFFP